MFEIKNQSGNNYQANLSSNSSSTATQPLFLPIKAPSSVGDVIEYKFVLLQRTVPYAMHWDLPNGRKRAYCFGDVCPHCKNHKPATVYRAGVVQDLQGRRFAIVQIGQALVDPMKDAWRRYLKWLRTYGYADEVDVCDISDPWQPAFHVKASCSVAGPHFKVDARPMRDEGKQISLAEWRLTPDGKESTREFMDRTAAKLQRALPDFTNFDPLPLIFPEECAVMDADEDDVAVYSKV